MKKHLSVLALSISFFIVAAQSNYALNLNGTTQYVTIGTPITSSSSYTKEAWVYVTTTSGARNIISSTNAPFWLNGSTLSAGQAGNYSSVADPTAFPANTWVHVAVTYNAATTTMTLYRDGIAVNSNNAVSSYTAENTFIGSHQGSSSFLQGYTDEVRIWNTALTQAQLKQNIYKGPANNASGLVAYYKCDAGSGTLLFSSCTNTTGMDGTLQNSTAWIASPVQAGTNAISFDGSNDFVTIPSNASLNITSAITMEVWCYATKNSGIQNVICKSSNSMNTGYIFPRSDDGWSHVILYLNIGGWKTLSATYPSLNAWHHLAATYDGATMKLYIDGVLAASAAQTGAIATNTNPLTLGNQAGYSEYFGGSADEFRLWNVARTQTEIQNNMNKELDISQPGLVSYYHANQGIAAGTNTGLTTLIDMKGTNNGTLTSFALSGSSSNFVVQNAGIVILPVSFTSFIAQQKSNTVLLQWGTASEQNSKDFIIQHSTDGSGWNNIGSVPAAGNSNTQKDYGYVHTNPVNGINYYRIQQTDLDGRSNYSGIRTIRFTNDDRSFRVLNNPGINGRIYIKLTAPADLSLYSSEGKMLLQQRFNAGTTALDVSSFAKGIYFLKAGNKTEKIILH